jgi:hypothetical protein
MLKTKKKKWTDGPKKRWMDCVKDDIRIKGLSMNMTSDRTT